MGDSVQGEAGEIDRIETACLKDYNKEFDLESGFSFPVQQEATGGFKQLSDMI